MADTAILVVDAVSGVQVQTEKTWQAAEELGLPRFVVVNRLDRERASLERALKSIHGTLNRTVVPIQLPIGEEKSFRGVVDLVSQKAYIYQADGSGKFTESAIPQEMADETQAAREALIEMVAEADEPLMEKFFEAGTLTQEQLVSGLRSAAGAGKLFPLFCTSSLLNIGVQPLLDAILAYVPSPAEKAQETGPASAFVWKTIADPFAGRITMFRVMSGTVKADATLYNKTRDASERLGHVVLLQGKTQSNVPELKAGDLGAVAKLRDTLTSDTLGDKGDQTGFPATTFPEPVLS